MNANQLRRIMFVLLLGVFSLGAMNAQTMIVRGIVTDNRDNSPLIGCSVSVKGTVRGTATDMNGKYAVYAQKGDTLVFSYIGFQKVEKRVTSTTMDIAMEESHDAALETVVVCGIAANKKVSVVGAVSAVNVSRLASPVNSEEYASFDENGFKKAYDSPLSTFSVDVDVAAYSNMRRFINKGELPPPYSARTEELVNYFSYDYPKPTGKDPVKITTEVGTCPWNAAHRLVRIGLKAKEIPTDNLPVSNLVFLIDVSGSMFGPQRLDLVKSSLKLLVNNLREKDKVAIVVYSGVSEIKLEATSGANKMKIRDVIDELVASGATAGGAGIQMAYKIAKKNFVKEGNNRIILCTDGDFNVGVSSKDELERLIETERKSGVFLTVLGYGMGNYKDSKMQVLAEKGNGNHAYIDNLQEANKVLVNEFGSTLHTVAKDVKLQIEFNPSQVQAYRLIGYESRLLKDEDFNNDAKDAGEIGAGHTVTAFYEVIPVGVKNDYIGKVDELKYQKKEKVAVKSTGSDELMTIKLRYKEPDGNASRKIELSLKDTQQNNVSSDFRFAAAAAMFGQLLNDSSYKGDASFDKVIQLAKTGLENDNQGYRREFIRLVETTKGLSQSL